MKNEYENTFSHCEYHFAMETQYEPLDLSLKKRKREDEEDEECVHYRNAKILPVPSVTVGDISVKLECYELWKSFSENLMEMIITRKGRRMFPAVAISIQGMNPNASYRIMLQILPSDPFLYKFINQTWTRGRYNGFETPNSPFEHELSPKIGRFWMDSTIHFHTVKLTNCGLSSDANFLLKAMQKYNACITVVEYLGEIPYKVYNYPFPETTFIAVTAYHSREIVDRKIDANPFAKAFKGKRKDEQNDKVTDNMSDCNLG